MQDTDATLEHHKDLVRRWLALFSDVDGMDADQIAADDYIEHALAPFGSLEPGLVDGPAHLRAAAAWLTAQFPDIEMTVESIIGEGDMVALRVATRGTNLGPLNGVIPPTGRTFSARQSHWFRIRDERLAEHWATREDLVAMLQLGVVAGPGRPTGGGAEPRPEQAIGAMGVGTGAREQSA